MNRFCPWFNKLTQYGAIPHVPFVLSLSKDIAQRFAKGE